MRPAAGARAGGLDDVRVDRALGEPAHLVELRRLLLEHLDEEPPDDLALGLRVGDTGERLEKARLGVHANDLHPHVLGEGPHHLIALVEPEQAVVDEHADETLADGAVQQGGDHRGVDPARQREQDAPRADLLADALDGILDDVAGGPQPRTPADLPHEPLEHHRPLAGVGHLGMELDAEAPSALVDHRRVRRVLAGADGAVAGRQFLDTVTVTHPDVQLARIVGETILQAVEQRAFSRDAHRGVAELAVIVRAPHDAAELPDHRLHAVADAQDRQVRVEYRVRDARRVLVDDRFGTTGEDHAVRPEVAHRRVVDAPRTDLAVDPALAHPPRDELCRLAAEVEYEDALVVDVAVRARRPDGVVRHRRVGRGGSARGCVGRCVRHRQLIR